MKNILILFLIIVSTPELKANEQYFNKIVDCIYKIEGGDKTKHPYGILSVKTKNKEEARKICFNTVKNNFKRWSVQKSKMDYISFLARVYCPIGAENDNKGLNANWEKNLRFYLRQ